MYEEALRKIEWLLCQRYNVNSLVGLEPLMAALTAAHAGDLTALVKALGEREMYRWQPELEAALVEAKASTVAPVIVIPVTSEPPEEPAEEEATPEVEEVEEEPKRRSRK